jgi:hypothetical protein
MGEDSEMKDKPVAYGMLTFCKNCGEQNPYAVKTLTDEEIMNLYKETKADNGGIREFVRAILKKASEK